MSKVNSIRTGCRDVWNASLVCHATYAGIFELPIINPTYGVPNNLISFSKCLSAKSYDSWVHFYEDDYLFERIWRNPQKYMELFFLTLACTEICRYPCNCGISIGAEQLVIGSK